jgi:hypothetical protein
MAERHDDGSIAPRRGLGGPILPPPPPELSKESPQESQGGPTARPRQQSELLGEPRKPSAQTPGRASGQPIKASPASAASASAAPAEAARRPAREPRPPKPPKAGKASPATKSRSPRRTRRAQLRLVQIDAWSVMKTSFLLSIALGIVFVVAVAIIWSVLGAAGVWTSINSIVQQAVGSESGKPFDIQEYAGTSRVLGFSMIVAVLDVILITAISTLGAFLYNLSAALLGGIEVTLAEDS